MTTLREFAIAHKGKKEIFDLKSIPADIEIKQDNFTNAQGKELTYNYIEIDGYKYTVKANVLSNIKRVLENRPATKSISVEKDEKGNVFVIPLD